MEEMNTENYQKATYIFARALSAVLDDMSGLIIKDTDGKHRLVYKEGAIISVSEDDYPQIPEGTRIEITKEAPVEKTEETVEDGNTEA